MGSRRGPKGIQKGSKWGSSRGPDWGSPHFVLTPNNYLKMLTQDIQNSQINSRLREQLHVHAAVALLTDASDQGFISIL